MEKIFMLTVDGTSSGEYEHSAYSLLFKTKEEADNFVDSDFITQVVNAGIVADDADSETISGAVEDQCIWFDEWNASFKFGDARTDYHIEIVKIPS